MVNVLHRMGFDEVFDTSYGADLTVTEESEELLNRLELEKIATLFTSCCPVHEDIAENRYPEFAENLSTCRGHHSRCSAL